MQGLASLPLPLASPLFVWGEVRRAGQHTCLPSVTRRCAAAVILPDSWRCLSRLRTFPVNDQPITPSSSTAAAKTWAAAVLTASHIFRMNKIWNGLRLNDSQSSTLHIARAISVGSSCTSPEIADFVITPPKPCAQCSPQRWCLTWRSVFC